MFVNTIAQFKKWYYLCTKKLINLYSIMAKPNLYYVDWYTEGGFCYRTTSNCTWSDVLACKRQAKWLGETIKYSRMN